MLTASWARCPAIARAYPITSACNRRATRYLAMRSSSDGVNELGRLGGREEPCFGDERRVETAVPVVGEEHHDGVDIDDHDRSASPLAVLHDLTGTEPAVDHRWCFTCDADVACAA